MCGIVPRKIDVTGMPRARHSVPTSQKTAPKRSTSERHRGEKKKESAFQPDQRLRELLKHAEFVRPDGTPFWQFLRAHKIAFEKTDFPFLTAHPQPQVKQVFEFAEYMTLKSRGEALAYLYNGLGKALNYVGPLLDMELAHGFNDHTDRHTLWVSQTGVELLQRAGVSYDGAGAYDGLTEVLMTLVGMTHDLGNLLSRKDHSQYSVWWLMRVFGKLTPKQRAVFEKALYAILFHEEPVLVALNMPIEHGIPLQWALVLADKMHVGRDRIGGRSFQTGVEQGAFEDDVHILLNALVVRSTWYLGERSFVWHLDFSLDQLEKKFASFTKGNHRLWVPAFFQKVLVNRGVRYRESFARLFRDIYGDRMRMAAKCAQMLFPYLDKFTVKLVDNDTRNKVGSGELQVWEQVFADGSGGVSSGASSLARRVVAQPLRAYQRAHQFYQEFFE